MEKRRQLVIYGKGDLAALAYRYFLEDSDYEPVAFAVDAQYRTEDAVFGLPVVDAESITTSHPPESCDLYIAIGYSDLNKARARIFNESRQKGYKLATYISTSATVPSDLDIGENCLIMEGVVIQPFAKLGNNIVLWSGCLVSHHVTMHDHCFVGAHAVISGRCTIGEFSFIGVNATIKDKVTVAKQSLIGASAVILADTAENKSYLSTETKNSGIPSDRLQALL